MQESVPNWLLEYLMQTKKMRKQGRHTCEGSGSPGKQDVSPSPWKPSGHLKMFHFHFSMIGSEGIAQLVKLWSSFFVFSFIKLPATSQVFCTLKGHNTRGIFVTFSGRRKKVQSYSFSIVGEIFHSPGPTGDSPARSSVHRRIPPLKSCAHLKVFV